MSKQIDGSTTFAVSDLVGLGQFSSLGPLLRWPAMRSVGPMKSEAGDMHKNHGPPSWQPSPWLAPNEADGEG